MGRDKLDTDISLAKRLLEKLDDGSLMEGLVPVRYEWHELPFYKKCWFAAKVLITGDHVDLPIKSYRIHLPIAEGPDLVGPYSITSNLDDYMVPVRHYTKEKPKLTLINGGKD